MPFIKEFKEFAVKGNVVDIGVGIVIGAAFSTIVNSFVKDILNPPLGLLTGEIDFSDKLVVLKEATESATAVTVNYGLFINALINFFIVAFAIFLVVKQINRLKKEAPSAPAQKECPHCFSKIPIAAKKCAFCTSNI